jgi:predicted transposase YdaD
VQIIPLTDQEILEREQQAAQAAIEQAEREAEAQRIADLKESAKAKLIAGEPMTPEEASVLIG